MKNLLDAVANVLAKVTYTSAVVGAGTQSTNGAYQPKTPASLCK